jgi:hypothetical protein
LPKKGKLRFESYDLKATKKKRPSFPKAALGRLQFDFTAAAERAAWAAAQNPLAIWWPLSLRRAFTLAAARRFR